MKRLIPVVLALIMIAGIGKDASAANSIKEGTLGLNVNVLDSFIISGKYFIMSDVALLGGLGFGFKGEDASGTDFGIVLGARKYLSTNDLAPFAGARFTYSSTEDGDAKDAALFGEFGAECFLHKQFSIEGTVGLGYMTQERTTTVGSVSRTRTESNFGTSRFGVSFNFYF